MTRLLNGAVRQWQHLAGLALVVFVCGGPLAFAGGFTSAGTSLTGSGAVYDPIVPADGTQNVTGHLAVGGNISATNGAFITNGGYGLYDAGGGFYYLTGGNVSPWWRAVSNEADGASAIAFRFNNNTTLSNASAKLLSVQNNGSEKFYVTAAGGLAPTTYVFGTGNGTATNLVDNAGNVLGSISDGGTEGTIKMQTGQFDSIATRAAVQNLTITDGSGNLFATMFDDGTTGSMQLTGTKSRGTITLSAGSGTATVNSGAVCVCTDTTANASVKCTVSTTTLTATGTGTDAIAYICL